MKQVKNSDARVIFFGNEKLASGVDAQCFSLNALVEAGYEVVAVVVNQAAVSSRKKDSFAVIEVANRNNIPVVVYTNSSQMLELIETTNADVAVLSAFGRIIKQEVIEAFRYGILNIHPSLLPKYRGSSPIESAILNQDGSTGVSLMQLTASMDAGPIFCHSEIELGEPSKQELYEQLGEIGAVMLIELLPDILQGNVKPLNQDESQVSYCGTIEKQVGDLYFDQFTSEEIAAQIKAYLGWPGSKTKINGHSTTVLQAKSVVEPDTQNLSVIDNTFFFDKKNLFARCKNNTVLAISDLQPAGKKAMTAVEFINGYCA